MKRKYYLILMSIITVLSGCSMQSTEGDESISATVESGMNTEGDAGNDDQNGGKDSAEKDGKDGAGNDNKDGTQAQGDTDESAQVPIAIDETHFPDAKFRQYVSDILDPNKDGILEVEERESVTNISCGVVPDYDRYDFDTYDDGFMHAFSEEETFKEVGREYPGITSLKGIEYFPNLGVLRCQKQQVTSLDVSKNTKLWWVNVANNPLESIDISNCPELIKAVGNHLIFYSEDGTTSAYDYYDNRLKVDYEDTVITGEFQDVDLDAWYRDAIYFACDNTLMNALKEGTFEPERAINRAQLMTAFFNMEDSPEVSYADTFVDVPREAWYARPVIWASKKKILSGISEDTFGVDEKITHEEFLKIIYDYSAKRGTFNMATKEDALEPYSDKDQISDQATSAMKWAVTNKIMEGIPCVGKNSLEPNELTTRAEAAQMLRNWLLHTIDREKYMKLVWAENEGCTGPICEAEEIDVTLISDSINEKTSSGSNLVEGAIKIDKENFPDPVFRQVVVDHCDTDGDRILEKKTLESVKVFDLSNRWIGNDGWGRGTIQSLKGIEFFPNLEALICADCSFNSMDLSKNTKLIRLYCNECHMTELDVSKNTHLRILECSNNQLPKLDISMLKELKELNCSDNLLTELDTANNTQLQNLDCSGNQLSQLDLGKNVNLEDLYCMNNQLSELDVRKNKNLSSISCNDNRLQNLDVTGLDKLYFLACYNNCIQNLNVSGHDELKQLECKGNPGIRIDIRECKWLCNAVDNELGDVQVCWKETTNYWNYDPHVSINRDFGNLLITGKYSDIPSGAVYEDDVMLVTNIHVMKGTSEDTFEPEKAVTRAEFVGALYILASKPFPNGTLKFTDVLQENSNAVTWAVQNNIATATEENVFGADLEMTHEQLITMLYNGEKQQAGLSKSKQLNTLENFSDRGEVSDCAKEAMQWAVTKGILNSTIWGTESTLDPKGIATRAQCAMLLKEYLSKVNESGKLKFCTY